MYKKHILALAATMIISTPTLLPFGKKQRNFLYTLHAGGEDFSKSNILQNEQTLDEYIYTFEAHRSRLEKRLRSAQYKARLIIGKHVALMSGLFLGTAAIDLAAVRLITNNPRMLPMVIASLMKNISSAGTFALHISYVWSAGAIYFAVKKRNDLRNALDKDTAILSKLIALKHSPKNKGISNE